MTGFNVLVEIDGKTYPVSDCEWVFFLACGCPMGCMHADTVEEEAAWKDMFYYAAERRKWRRQGVIADLMTREKFRDEVAPKMRLEYTCPHKTAEEVKP